MDRLAAVLLRRARLLHAPGTPSAYDETFARLVEADCAALGWLLDATALRLVGTMGEDGRVAYADWLVATLVAEQGGGRPHVPLFRGFGHHTPADTDALYTDRVLAYLFQEPDAPCLLCGTTDGEGRSTVAPVRPCGHLVCRVCFDPAQFAACPICNRRVAADSPYAAVPDDPPASYGAPLRLRVLRAGTDQHADATALRDRLVRRPTPLSADERADLVTLLDATVTPGDLSWLPPTGPGADQVASRETLGLVTGHALGAGPADPAVLAAVAARWQTATDVARTLWSWCGHDPGLTLPPRPQAPDDTSWERLRRLVGEPRDEAPRPRVRALPRPLRRAVLTALDAMPLRSVTEDLRRHRGVWRRLAERLHPYELAAAYPRASVAVTVLRGSRHDPASAAGEAVLEAAARGDVRLLRGDDGRVGAVALTFAARWEQALAAGDPAGAADVLAERPGELLRHLDLLGRRCGDAALADRLVAAARQAAETGAPRVALAAYASLRGRDEPVVPWCTAETDPAPTQQRSSGWWQRVSAAVRGTEPPAAQPRPTELVWWPRRIFWPRGGAAATWTEVDRRRSLEPELLTRLRAALAAGVEARASRLPRFEVVVLDPALAEVPLPQGTQRASGSSRPLPRGTTVPLPEGGDVLRLFLHWTDVRGRRVDLDLSVALLDEQGRLVDYCDFTRLKALGCTHSGDLTSAPAPLGSSEFCDLDLPVLRRAGVEHVVPSVLSYNDVAFERLTDAYVGLMLPTGAALFDPARVLVRFDLRGEARRYLPCLVDLRRDRVRWLDLHLPSQGYGHNLVSSSHRIRTTLLTLEQAYRAGTRPSAYDLAARHARARCDAAPVEPADVTPDDLAGRRVLWVGVGEPPTVELGPGSVVVSVTADSPHTLDDLLVLP